jgi:hypothetical protein
LSLPVGTAIGAVAVPPPDLGAAVLARRCVTCHNDTKKAGGIDLSTRAGAASAGVVGPDDPARNRLVRAITAGKMPPTGRLPVAEIAQIRGWIRGGAAYPDGKLQVPSSSNRPLWSLQPVTRPPVPRPKAGDLAANPIDRFILDRLAREGLRPSPPAARAALLRRVTVDLTGLPPTPKETEVFVADRSPDAYRKVVERLLGSPAYGERWAQHWLDVVRYGESHGYEQNHLRPNAWPYRDYVIRALNEDRPYTRMIEEQLAGDLVGKGDPAIEVATGFLVAGIHDTVGNQTEQGTRQQRANDLDDIVSTTSETFLGLTVGCAKCHDHKFDPIPQRDYYRLAAVFAGVRHGERRLLPTAATADEREAAELARSIRLLSGRLIDLDAEVRTAVLRSQGVSPVPRPAVSARRNVDEFAPVRAKFVRFTVLSTRDGTEPCLDELEVYGAGDDANLAAAATGAKASASSLLPGYPIHQVAHLNDQRYGNDWSWISRERGTGWAQIELPVPAEVRRIVWSRDSSDVPRFGDRLPGDYRIEVSEDASAWRVVATGEDRAEAPEAIPGGVREQAITGDQSRRRAALQESLEKLRQRAGVDTGAAAYAGTFTAPEPVYVLKRGDVMQRAEEVVPGGLSRAPGYPGDLNARTEPERRLALARWLGNASNPLTARVMVNRIWQGHFGCGIVATPSDFGRNGEKPSHPELLDWLAADFMANGWTLKRLHRMIVTSYTYRQSSAPDPAGMAKDAGNRLLWRMPLRRMEAETVRDAILATSGKLDRRMGGPSFRLFRYRVVNVAIYEPLEEHSPETWRRSVYRQPARAIRDDLLGSFDCPESAQRTPRRENTTTALQALSLLNGPFSVQQSGFFAERVRREAGERSEAQVARAYCLAFGRAPTGDEAAAALGLLSRRGLPALCRGLLNANEFLYY